MADDFKTRAYQFYVSQGYAPHQAAALAANAVAESGGNTRAVHDKDTGVGIFGFRDPEPGKGRKTDLFNWAKQNDLDPYAEETQLKFSQHELTGSEKAAGDKIRSAKTYQDAINATLGYLRPQGYTADNPYGGHNYTGRYNEGAQLAGVAPLTGPAVAAAGGSGVTTPTEPTATPSGGVNPEIIAGLLAKQQDQSATTAKAAALAEEAKQQAAMSSVIKQGMGLLGSADTPAPQMAMQPAAIHRPQVQPLALGGDTPDFATMLARQRLMRRV